jgi:regulator of sirC expression with transglutaminase-like and TPR domain
VENSVPSFVSNSRISFLKFIFLVENKEISALFHLLDDPDEAVYSTISNKIISYGTGIIPNLENLWETTPDLSVQKRIESIIHGVQFREFKEQLTAWKDGSTDLLSGALLIDQFLIPDMHEASVHKEMEKLRRNIWLELNNYLTPLEQVNIISSILFNYYKLRGTEIAYQSPEPFLVSKVFESKKGNAISNGIIYTKLCELLDIPVRAINIPNQFILAYLDYRNPAADQSDAENIVFFIDPINGQAYSHQDVNNYLKRYSLNPTPSFFTPLPNKKIIKILLHHLSKCFENGEDRFKSDELNSILDMLN